MRNRMERFPQSEHPVDEARENQDSDREKSLADLLRDSPRNHNYPGFYPGAGEYYPSHVLAGRPTVG